MLELNDGLKKEESIKKLNKMEFQKQVLRDSIATAEKERLMQVAHKEEIQKKNRTRNVLIGSGFILLLLAGGFYSRWRYVRRSRDIISKEKDRSDNLLLNILPAEIAQELKEKGEAAARDFEMVSILFTDFKEFTQVSEKLSAAELVNEINACFKAFDTICGKYKVEKIKTIGDAYMAAGGLPIPTDDSVKNTVLAALEMQEFISYRKSDNTISNKPAFEMRVGIHTGPVVAGIVGVKKFQYDIWGDTVNTASRVENLGETGKVNISKSTYDLIKDNPVFSFEQRGHIEVKGKGEMEMYFVSRKINNSI
jgi:class 3 adenylate cyclase